MTPFLKDLLGVDVSVRIWGQCAGAVEVWSSTETWGGVLWAGSDLADETVPMLVF